MINWKLILKEPRWVIKITIGDWLHKIRRQKRHPLEYRIAKNTVTDKLYRILPDQQLSVPYVEVDYYESYGKKFPIYDWKGILDPRLSMLVRLTEEQQRVDYANVRWRSIWGK